MKGGTKNAPRSAASVDAAQSTERETGAGEVFAQAQTVHNTKGTRAHTHRELI